MICRLEGHVWSSTTLTPVNCSTQAHTISKEVILRRGSFVEVLIKVKEEEPTPRGDRWRCRIEDLYTMVSTGHRFAVIRKVWHPDLILM